MMFSTTIISRFLLLGLHLSVFVATAAAIDETQQNQRGVQQLVVGQDICSCAPSIYQFTLDFSRPCNPTTGPSASTSTAATNDDEDHDGDFTPAAEEENIIDATTCRIVKFGGQSITDLTPVGVHSIEILELGQKLQVMKQVNMPGNFGDGHIFKYNSIVGGGGISSGNQGSAGWGSSNNDISNNMPAPTSTIVHPDDLPRAIQLNIAGVNESGQSIVNIMMIEFKNRCSSNNNDDDDDGSNGGSHHESSNIPAPPIIDGGKQSSNISGWTRLTDLVPPSSQYCPSGLRLRQ